MADGDRGKGGRLEGSDAADDDYDAWRVALGPRPRPRPGWRHRLGESGGLPVWVPEPVGLPLGDRRQSAAAWDRELGWKPGTVRQRLKRGWSVEDALTVPPVACRGWRRQWRARTRTDD